MTTSPTPTVSERRPKRKIPPLVIAVFLFLGPAFGALSRHIRQPRLMDNAVTTGDNFLKALDTRRYADASSMADPEIKEKMTELPVKKLARSMQNTDGRIVFQYDSCLEFTTSDNDREISLTYRVQTDTGWKPVIVSLLESPDGLKVSDCTVDP